MGGSFLRIAGYGAMDGVLLGEIKKAVSVKNTAWKFSFLLCRFPPLVLSRSGMRVVQYVLDISAKTLP